MYGEFFIEITMNSLMKHWNGNVKVFKQCSLQNEIHLYTLFVWGRMVHNNLLTQIDFLLLLQPSDFYGNAAELLI